MRGRLLVAAAVLLLAPSGGLAAQTVTQLRGVARDTAGTPVAGLEVVLHRVNAAGGARLDTDTTAADGSFQLSADATPDPDAIYFAATRIEGRLYVGEFVRPPLDRLTSYELQVGGEPFSMDSPVPTSAMPVTPPMAPARSDRRALLAMVPLLGLIAVAGWWLARGSGTRRHRRLLVRLAELEEEAERATLDPAEQRERERILKQLLTG